VSVEGKPTSGQDRRLLTLQRLLALDALEITPTLREASRLVADAVNAAKVDVFLYDADTDCLVAIGTSDTPMGRREQAIGLDRIPIAGGGLAVETFQTGVSYLTGHADREPDELAGLTESLGVRSEIITPLVVNGERRGVLQAFSTTPNRFSTADLDFLEAVSRWVGLVAHRAELVERLTHEAVERGRRLIVQELSALTPRELEIASLVATGLSNEKIADELSVSRGTVANHVEHILDKLRFRNRVQIAAWAVEHGLHRPGMAPADED
jgi:two-component system, OmpR family, sensor kinase